MDPRYNNILVQRQHTAGPISMPLAHQCADVGVASCDCQLALLIGRRLMIMADTLITVIIPNLRLTGDVIMDMQTINGHLH